MIALLLDANGRYSSIRITGIHVTGCLSVAIHLDASLERFRIRTVHSPI